MRALGAVVLGIGTYRYSQGVDPVPSLRFSADDADAVEAYLRTCWPAGDAAIRRVSAESATDGDVREAFAALAQGGGFDLLIVYLSGHGIRTELGTSFLLQPSSDVTELALLRSEALDEALDSIRARRVVLILDCCFAEAIVRSMEFFRRLGESEARLFIASSRADQLTWEEEKAGHGVFTAFLLDLLNIGSSAHLPGAREKVDVDAELFPFLCTQVPLYVLEHKGARQEPVKGGMARSTVFVPVTRKSRRLRDRTALSTAIRRVRQIVSATAAGVLASLVLAYAFLYYAETDREGEIVLRHGTRWLDPVFKYISPIRVRTGIAVEALSSDATLKYPVQSGSMVGIWTHQARAGYRKWYDDLAASLVAGSRHRHDVLVGGASAGATQWPNPLEARPADVEFAAWTMLTRPDKATFDWTLATLPGSDQRDGAVTPFPVNKLQFGIIDLTPQQWDSYAAALTYLAIVDPERTYSAYVGFLKAAQEWFYQNRNGQRFASAREHVLDSVSAILPIIEASRIDRGLSPLPKDGTNVLLELAAKGYFETVGMSLARTRSPAEHHAIVRQLAISKLRGTTLGMEQLVAMRVLINSADGSIQAKKGAVEVYAFFDSLGNLENAYLTKFLIDMADRHSLPSSVRTGLLDYARAAILKVDRQFLDQEYARILAHGMADLNEAERDVVYKLIVLVSQDITPRSEAMAEIYGILGRNRLDGPGMLDQVLLQCAAFRSGRAGSSGVDTADTPGLVVSSGGVAWAYALAQFGASRRLPAQAVSDLQYLARLDSLRPFRDTLEVALAKQMEQAGDACAMDLCLARLRTMPFDSSTRDLDAALAARTIAQLPREQYLAALSQVRQVQARETEPEVRIALGEILVNAQLLRFSGELGSHVSA